VEDGVAHLEATVVEKVDAAWRAKGIKSRMEFLRQAFGST
jgi:metal-responsive CopG/Arc/MetJ family transcriptional regulator